MDDESFELAVDSHYQSLYRFALSLTRREADAWDLTQETYRRLADRGHQIKDPSRIKSWLFTTLHRRFITAYRREVRFPHFELSLVGNELPAAAADSHTPDIGAVLEALGELREKFQIPLALFYLEQHSYAEIAEVMGVPIGTVMSRISRGREMLRVRLEDAVTPRTPCPEPPPRLQPKLLLT